MCRSFDIVNRKLKFKWKREIKVSLKVGQKVPLKFWTEIIETLTKVTHTKYSKHRPSTVAHTFECVCSKIKHVLNHGLFILFLKLINCPIH